MTGVGDWQTMFGQAVRGRRQELGLTLDEARAAIGISRSHLNLIELGKATGISRDCAAKIDAGLGFELALLALLPASSTDADSTAHDGSEREMRRAEFNKAMLALGASLLLDIDAERLFGTQSVDEALLEDLESLTADFAERQHHARPQTILGPVRAHLRHLLDLEGVSAAPDLRPRLARVTAETATLAGWVSFRGQGDLVAAHGHLALGRRHARAAGDHELTAQVIGLSSSLYSSLDIPQGDKDQRPSLALNLLRAAQRKAGNNGSLSLQGWLAARVAGEHALLGEGRKARAALARAEAAVPSRQTDPAGLLVIWDETRIPGYAGKALLLLRDPAATKLLEQALSQTSAPHPRVGLLVDLAVARVYDGEADQAVALLIEATQLAVARGIDRFARWRLQEGRAALPASHQRMFDRRLAALA